MIIQFVRDICKYEIKMICSEHKSMLSPGTSWYHYFCGERFLFGQITEGYQLRELVSPERLRCFPKKTTSKTIDKPKFRTDTINMLEGNTRTVTVPQLPEHTLLLKNNGRIKEEIENQLLAQQFGFNINRYQDWSLNSAQRLLKDIICNGLNDYQYDMSGIKEFLENNKENKHLKGRSKNALIF